MAEYGEIRIPVVVEAEEALSALEALAAALEDAGGKAAGAGETESRAALGTDALTRSAYESAAAYLALGRAAASGLALLLEGEKNSSRMEQALAKLNQGVASLAQRQDAVNLLRQMAQEAQQNGTTFTQLDPVLQTFIRAQGLMEAGMDQVVAALRRQESAMTQAAASMMVDLRALLTQWNDAKTAIEAGAHAVLTADGTPLMNEVDAAIARLNQLLALLRVAGKAGGKKGGEDEGGSKAGDAESTERAAGEDDRELARRQREALNEQIRLMEQKKRMGELSAREEIRELERIQRKYAANAELRLEMENRLFEARARQRDEEIAQIDRLNQGIITALRSRYQEQRDLEQRHLDQSIQAWQDWAEETVAAIQAQVDALDKAARQEGRDEKEQKALRKIDERKMALTYETDAYARGQLEREIARLEEDLSRQRREWAREDEKEQLRERMTAVKQRAQAEQEAIQGQKEALDQVYEQLTQAASLQAEAEKMLVQSSRTEIVRLIGSYAPAYEATGKTLGERLYQGLAGSWGNISKWFEKFETRIQKIQNQAASAATQLADQHYGGQLAGGEEKGGASAATTVEQTVHFHVPVERASDVTRRMEAVNQALAEHLAG